MNVGSWSPVLANELLLLEPRRRTVRLLSTIGEIDVVEADALWTRPSEFSWWIGDIAALSESPNQLASS